MKGGVVIPIRCHTNLDLLPAERWPDELPAVPAEGQLIRSAHQWAHHDEDGKSVHYCYVELCVVRVTWYHDGWNWVADVELHLPPSRFESLRTFYDWYGKITGRGAAYFI